MPIVSYRNKTADKVRLRPKKSLGQHFLRDRQVIDAILRLAKPKVAENVLEIGPGEGVLSEALLAAETHLIAVETDYRLWEPLAKRFAGRMEGNFLLERSDFLKCDLEALLGERRDRDGRFAVIANIPYQITTPILFTLVRYRRLFSRAILMMQEEVAARIMASPGSKDYGRLTLGIGLYCDVESGFKVSPSAFVPRPKVWSRVIRLKFRDQPRYPVADELWLEKIVALLFSQRRKKLINPLLGLLPNMERKQLIGLLATIDIDPDWRPDKLDPEAFVRLANYLKAIDCLQEKNYASSR